MTNLRRAVLSLVVLLLALLPLALAQGTYTQIDVPGSTKTQCLGIDSAGDVVGYYSDGTNLHGFLLSGGTYTTIDYRGVTTVLSGINDLGQIVGSAGGVGVVYNLQTQTFTTIRFPDTHGPTYATSINNAGTIAGDFFYHSKYQGFELIGSNYTHIAPPQASNTIVAGVSGSGKLVGYELNGFSFSYAQGTYHKLVIHGAPGITPVLGINPAGNTVVGFYLLSPPDVVAGFVYKNKTLQTLQFPGSNATLASGINDAGEVVGYFFDSNGTTSHGFTWTPPAAAAKQ